MLDGFKKDNRWIFNHYKNLTALDDVSKDAGKELLINSQTPES